MKIIFDSSNDSSKMHLRMIANIGCDKCPICGETRKFYAGGPEKTPIGVMKSLVPARYTIGVFKRKNIQIDRYTCYSCGSSWQSDPYEWDNF